MSTKARENCSRTRVEHSRSRPSAKGAYVSTRCSPSRLALTGWLTLPGVAGSASTSPRRTDDQHCRRHVPGPAVPDRCSVPPSGVPPCGCALHEDCVPPGPCSDCIVRSMDVVNALPFLGTETHQ